MLKRGQILLILFNLLYIVPFTIYYALIRDYEFLSYILVLVIIAVIVGLTLKKSKLDYLALGGLSIWGLLHLAGGGIRINNHSLYSTKLIEIINKTDISSHFFILKMDQLIHFYGFLVTAIVIYQLIYHRYNKKASPYLLVFLAWIGSMGLGALNEVIEFIAFLSLSQTGVGDVYNTGFDLIFNMFGAFIGSLIQFYRYGK